MRTLYLWIQGQHTNRTYIFEGVLLATTGASSRRNSLASGEGKGSAAAYMWESPQFWEDVFCGKFIFITDFTYTPRYYVYQYTVNY